MGALLPIGSLLGLAQTGAGAWQQYQMMQYQRAQQDHQQRWQIWQQQQADRAAQLQERRITAAEDGDIARMRTAVAETTDQRRQALRRAIARQRARMGASGTGAATGGSGEAILLGLIDDAALAEAGDRRDLKGRIDQITADRHYRRRIGLLDRSHPGPQAPIRPVPGWPSTAIGIGGGVVDGLTPILAQRKG